MRAPTSNAAKTEQLFLAGCFEECAAKPVGFALAGITNGSQNIPRFARSQTHREHFSQCVLFSQPGPAHFLCHRKNTFCLQKHLDRKLLCVYKKSSLEFRDFAFVERMAGTAAGESELTSSLPVSAGASHRESEMKATTFQVRSLAIEATGDFFLKKTAPKIRLSGQWLERAGFPPGHRVEVRLEQPGSLTLRFVKQPKEAAL